MGTTGYPPIVASGYDSAILHYSANNQRYESGALLLVDAAGSKDQVGWVVVVGCWCFLCSRARRVHERHHAHVPRQWRLHTDAAQCVRECSGRSTCSRHCVSGRHVCGSAGGCGARLSRSEPLRNGITLCFACAHRARAVTFHAAWVRKSVKRCFVLFLIASVAHAYAH